MSVKRGARSAGVALTAALGVGLGVVYDPYLLVRAQFERQRINAGLDAVEVALAGHRWTVAQADAGVRFNDNQFGLDVLAGKNPFGVSDAQSLRRYIDIVFHREAAKPWIPWPASRGMIAKRKQDAGFEQSVLERIGRGPERFAPGEAATSIRQPALLLWGRQDAVIDPSALDLYAALIPQARTLLVDDAGHMALMEQPRAVADAVVELIERGQPR